MLAVGSSLSVALKLAHEVENLAHMYTLTRQLGEPKLLSEAQMQEVMERFKTYGTTVKTLFPVGKSRMEVRFPVQKKSWFLNENYEELRSMIKDALEDALVLGCSEKQVRESFHALIDEIQSDIKECQHNP